MILCLDNGNPQEDEQLARSLYCTKDNWGNKINRYYDKPVQLVMFENSKTGVIGEHSGIDGVPFKNVLELVANLELNLSLPPKQQEFIDAPYQLTWDLTPSLLSSLRTAELNYELLINRSQLNLLNFNDYGNDFIKNCNVSPDSWFQLALQLTYYRLHGRIDAVYESGSTARYRRGRTEVVRSVSLPSVDFVQTMIDPNKTKQEKIIKLKDAANYHVSYMKKAIQGYGVDRHLLGLKLLMIENKQELHPIFTDYLFKKSSTWNLSTSQLRLNLLGHPGFGPVLEDCYGCCYSIRKNAFKAAITTFSNGLTDGVYYRDCLEESLRDMRDLFLGPKL